MYPLLVAAIEGRFRDWPGHLCIYGQISGIDGSPSYRLVPDRLRLGRPWHLRDSNFDWLQLYAAHPTATGVLYLRTSSVSQERATLWMSHNIGATRYHDWDGPEDARPDGPRPDSFDEWLDMELSSGAWRLVNRRDFHRHEPPTARESRTRRELSEQLGSDWELLDLSVNRRSDLESCRVRFEGRTYRFAVGSTLKEGLYYDPLIILGWTPITADHIREGIRLYLDQEASSPESTT